MGATLFERTHGGTRPTGVGQEFLEVARRIMRSGFPRFTVEAIIANQPVIDLLKKLAARNNASPTQIALA